MLNVEMMATDEHSRCCDADEEDSSPSPVIYSKGMGGGGRLVS